jgi:hypothetical protein
VSVRQGATELKKQNKKNNGVGGHALVSKVLVECENVDTIDSLPRGWYVPHSHRVVAVLPRQHRLKARRHLRMGACASASVSVSV